MLHAQRRVEPDDVDETGKHESPEHDRRNVEAEKMEPVLVGTKTDEGAADEGDGIVLRGCACGESEDEKEAQAENGARARSVAHGPPRGVS